MPSRVAHKAQFCLYVPALTTAEDTEAVEIPFPVNIPGIVWETCRALGWDEEFVKRVMLHGLRSRLEYVANQDWQEVVMLLPDTY